MSSFFEEQGRKETNIMGDYILNVAGAGELVMGGDLTIENAAKIRAGLLEALGKGGPVIVRIEGDAVMDVSFMQILCSAHNAAVKSDKPFCLSYAIPGNFIRAVVESGYKRNRGCSRDKNGSCLWVLGGKQ